MARISALIGIGILFGGGLVSAVEAQSPPAVTDDGDTLEEIVVTAEKREEDVQKTPINITTIQREQLEQKGLVDLDETLKEVPGVKITSSPQGQGGSISIRGVGDNFLDPTISSQPAVAINVDGVVNTNPNDIMQSMFDVDRVEVLKGPQGTLYGSSAEGGVVNIVMAQPKHEFEASGRVQVGNYESHVLEGMVNLPIGDMLALRLTASDSKRDGYINGPGTWVSPLPCAVTKNPNAVLFPGGPSEYDPTACTGTFANPGHQIPYVATNYGATGTQTYRAKLLYQPTDWLSITGTYEYSLNKGTATQFVSLSDFDAGRTNYSNSTLSEVVAQHESESIGNTWETGILDVEARLGDFALLTFLPTIKDTIPYFGGLASGAAALGKTTQYTDDLRLSSLATSTFKWTLGAYYTKEEASVAEPSGLASSPTDGSYGVVNVGRPFNDWNLYGQLTYPVTAALRLTAGARYTHTKSTYAYQLYQTDLGGALNSAGEPLVIYESPTYDRSIEETNVSYKVGAEYDLAVQSMLYADVSTGFKAGGLGVSDNTVGVTAPIRSASGVVVEPFKPETSTDFEIGSKNRFLNDTLQVNGDIFYNIWKNMQLGSFACAPGDVCTSTAPGAQSDLIAIVYNAQSSTQYGAELNTSWLATSKDRVDLNLSALHGTYGNLTESFFGTPESLTGHTMANSPTLAGDVAYSHTFRLKNDMTLTPRADEQFSTHYFDTEQYWLAGSENGGYGHTDVTLTLSGKKWSVNAYGRNLFNSIQAQFAHPLGIVPSDPRLYGVSVVGSY